ncbi:MAG: alpha/beta fold hydrolase [Candidatus Latescibacteria bacterium]|nr:alpha/beta fold hydrolase [Candidatus Latescibacterota bacterium]
MNYIHTLLFAFQPKRKRALLLLHYETYRAEPSRDWVVFVHGAGGSSSIWHRQLRAFKAHFNLLLLDLRGHGKSAHKGGGAQDYTFQAIATDILDVLDHRRIAAAHFVGISLGTVIIRALADLAPERMRSMVLGGAITDLNLRVRFLMNSGYRLKRLVPFMWLYQLFAWIMMPRRPHRFSRRLFVEEAKKLSQEEFIRWFKLSREILPLLDHFNRLEADVPTLYLMGDGDFMFLNPVRQLVERHQQAQVQILDRAGHVCNVDQHRRFNARAIAFIRQHRTTPDPKTVKP